MSIWKPNDVNTEPVTELSEWAVFEVPLTDNEGATRHFVGETRHGGRVSSAIQSFDKSNNCGISNSGRKYALLGPSCPNQGFTWDSTYVWQRWCAINRVKLEDIKNVTEEYDTDES